MIEYKRTVLLDRYHILEVFECPTDVIMFAATLGSENVTVENYDHYGKTNPISLNMTCGTINISPKLKRYELDFQITKQDFNTLKTVWHANNCYAIFHEISDLKFKAVNLEYIPRYRALDNFKWTLEIEIPGSASSGWGQISSPDKTIIDKVEEYIKSYC